jgi:hypothetical protein
VLGALRGWGDTSGEGTVTAQEATEYARLALTVTPIGRTQTPEITGTNAKVELSHGAIEKGPDLSRIVAGDAPTPPPTVKAETVPTAGGAGHLRLRATCGDGSMVLVGRERLVVQEILDAGDTTLTPTSDPGPSLRYDDAKHERVIRDPDFVDYDLPPGAHRIRVAARRCLPSEQIVTVVSGQTLEVAPKLERVVVPLVDVRFERPISAGDGRFELRDDEGKTACMEFPCVAKVPAKDNGFAITWTGPRGKELVTDLPDPDTTSGTAESVQIEQKQSRGFIGPLVIIAGAVVGGVAAGFLAWDQSYQCSPSPIGGAAQGSFTGHCGAVSGSESLSLVGIESVIFAITGGVTAGIGVVLTIMDVGGKNRLDVTYSSASSLPGKDQSELRIRLSPFGVQGTF